MTKITRDVISDLWPVYASGEATEDTRALVESFLADHPECVAEFECPVALPVPDAAIAPDAEARALVRTKELMRGGRWLHGVRLVALVLTVLALVRFYADTLEIFLVRLAIAAVAWALSAVLVLRERRRALRAEQERREHEGVLAAHESDLDICPPAQDPLEVSHCGHATEAAAEHDMRIIPPEARNSPFIN